MHLRAGTSGFSFKEWKGHFYPEKAKDKELLGLYAAQLDCVEINNTFYRMPKPELMLSFRERVGPGFVFVLKAPQQITHRQKLEGSEDSVAHLFRVGSELGDHLGPILFQLPPFLRRDLPRLVSFVASLPSGLRAVLEFRHRSWFDDEVFEALRARDVALCFSDTDPEGEEPGLEQPFASTASFGYVRLRRAAYDEAALRAWIERIRAQPWREVFVFFKHEPTAPGLALALRALWNESKTA